MSVSAPDVPPRPFKKAPVEFVKKNMSSFVSRVDRHITSRLPIEDQGTKHRVSIGISIFTVLFAVFGVGAQLLTVAIGVAYPVFKSFQAIKNTKESRHEDSKQWLTYWIVFGIFSLVETFITSITSIIPFYFVIKIMFLIWLFHPSTLGASTMFNVLINPILSKYERNIETQLKNITDTTKSIAKDITSDIITSNARNATNQNVGKFSEIMCSNNEIRSRSSNVKVPNKKSKKK